MEKSSFLAEPAAPKWNLNQSINSGSLGTILGTVNHRTQQYQNTPQGWSTGFGGSAPQQQHPLDGAGGALDPVWFLKARGSAKTLRNTKNRIGN